MMSEQHPQPNTGDAESEQREALPEAEFCPIDLPLQTTHGKLMTPGETEVPAPEGKPGKGKASLPPKLADKKSADKPVSKKPHALGPACPRPIRRTRGERSHDLLVRANPSQIMPQLIEETGERLHPRPKPPQKQRKSKRQLERVRRRQMNYLQARRLQKKKRLRNSRLRFLLKTVFAAFWLAVIWNFAQASFWTVQAPNVTLKNQNLLQASHLSPLLEPWMGQPVYGLDPQGVGAALQAAFPVIDEVYVRRKLFPTRLEVTVLEKTPWALVYPSQEAANPFAMISTTGRIISLQPYGWTKADVLNTAERPLNRVLLSPGQSFDRSALERLYQVSYQLGQMPALHLQYVDARDPERVVARFEEVEVYVGRLDLEVFTRLARLIPLAPKVLELQDEIDRVDLRWSRQVTLHRRPDPQAGGKNPAPGED